MNRFEGWRRWAWSILIVSAMAFALGGCDGKDGKDGLDGAPGPAGPPGPEGPAGPGASVTPLESCGVCHSDGSFASAPAAHEVFDVGSFADFAVTPRRCQRPGHQFQRDGRRRTSDSRDIPPCLFHGRHDAHEPDGQNRSDPTAVPPNPHRGFSSTTVTAPTASRLTAA